MVGGHPKLGAFLTVDKSCTWPVPLPHTGLLITSKAPREAEKGFGVRVFTVTFIYLNKEPTPLT